LNCRGQPTAASSCEGHHIATTQLPLLNAKSAELGLELDDTAIERFVTFRALLLEWNQRFNLTRVTEPDEVEIKLFLDSLALYPLLQRHRVASRVSGPLRLVDVGTGAGFPGLPLKIADPGIELTLVDATTKKVGFLNEAIRTLGLNGVRAVHGRAEELTHDRAFRSCFDVVIARAVAKLPVLVEICMPFCGPRGWGIFPKGREIEEEVASASNALLKLRSKLIGVETPLIPELNGTTFVVIEQVGKPPAIYPRRAGLPANSPL
jgi:16S rRNA (guanine527-N7)-methyltransferase